MVNTVICQSTVPVTNFLFARFVIRNDLTVLFMSISAIKLKMTDIFRFMSSYTTYSFMTFKNSFMKIKQKTKSKLGNRFFVNKL